MFTKERVVLSDEEFVPFGSSELISFGLRRDIIEGAVVVTDGAGTVVTRNQSLVQGLGSRMSGLIKTSPIAEVIEKIEEAGGVVFDKESAKIDQLAGVELAYRLGISNVAITVINAEDARIFATHLTGITKEGAESLSRTCDVITACASKWVRDVAGKRALLQAGSAIPVFAMTRRAKDLILEKLKEVDRQVLVKLETLLYSAGPSPTPLV